MNVTIKNIASLAGVSPATVSKALNGHDDISLSTKKRIIEISEKLGYTPNDIARSLVKKSSNILGLLIPDIASPVYTESFKGMDFEAKKLGYNLFLCDTNRNITTEKAYVEALMEKRVNGIIIAPVSGSIEHIIKLTRQRVPLVFLGGKVNDTMDNYVTNDNTYGAKIATEYLLSLGHEKIYMLVDSDNTKTKQDRIKAYSDCMVRSGFEPVVKLNHSDSYDGRKIGYNLFKAIFLSNDMPTAIFASNDMVALGIMEAAIECGIKIPEDLSIIGYDDIMFVSLPNIMLTTIAQPKYQIGSLAVKLLSQIIEEKELGVAHKIVIKPELVIRNTCKAITNLP